MTQDPKCELCGDPMPAGEDMFKFHGYSGPCPKPPLPADNSAHLEGERRIEPLADDTDVPLDVRRALMRAAVANGRISYLWLCAVYSNGVADGF